MNRFLDLDTRLLFVQGDQVHGTVTVAVGRDLAVAHDTIQEWSVGLGLSPHSTTRGCVYYTFKSVLFVEECVPLASSFVSKDRAQSEVSRLESSGEKEKARNLSLARITCERRMIVVNTSQIRKLRQC